VEEFFRREHPILGRTATRKGVAQWCFGTGGAYQP